MALHKRTEASQECDNTRGWPMTVRALSKTDDRRNKKYGREVVVAIEAPKAGVDVSRRIGALLAERFGGATLQGRSFSFNGVGSPWAHGAGGGHYQVRFFLPSERPSTIVSADDAVTWALFLTPLVLEAIGAAVDEREDWDQREEVARQATILAKWIGDTALKEALKVVRYDQRLTALRAELKAEIDVQLAALREGSKREEADKAIGKSDEAWSEDAIEKGWEHAGRYARVPTGLPFRSGGGDLSVSDIYPEPEEE